MDPAAAGVDVRLTDQEGVRIELLGFRRAAAENVVPGVLGAGRIAIPLRMIKRLEMFPIDESPYLDATAELKGGKTLRFKIPVYEEETAYRGDATFGTYRIRLGKIRLLEIHRVTPLLRDLDPLAASEGREKPEATPPGR